MSLTVPVIDVHNDNFNELWPALIVAIKTSSFIALDTELSGLGNRKSLLAESIEDRYKAICHAARSRSILSLGIACYRKRAQKAADTYLVQVYNLTLLCSEEYIIEPQSVQFLVHHGFDFNKQYSHGIPYCKGNNKGVADYCGVHIRALFVGLLRARKPLVLHNGLIDMAFLYQCFYAQLPERLVTFTADLSEMFPAGLYDTKYVTEFELRLTASYLEYAYKKCKLDNSRSVASGSTKPHVHIEFCQYTAHMSTNVDYRECPTVDSSEGKSDICQRFSAFGWCPNGTKCPLSHNTDLIVLQDEKSKDDKKKRKRRKAKKRGREEMTEVSSAFDGIPVDKMPNLEEDKMPNLEEDKKETSSDQQEAAAEPLPDTAPPVDMDGNSKHDQGQDMKPASEGNGTCEDKADLVSEGNGTCEDKADLVSEGNGPCEDKADLVNPETTGAADENRTGADDRSGDAQRKKADTGTHRAGFDAYMTGYIFAFSCALHKKEEVRAEGEEGEQAWHPDCVNKIYLSGKAAPLNIVKSTFSKSSKAHVQKMEMVWGGKI